MKLSDVDRFDPTLFSKDERAGLQKFMDECVDAKTVGMIEKRGTELDSRLATHRAEMRIMGQRSRSLHALFKRLIMEVPRRRGKAIVK